MAFFDITNSSASKQLALQAPYVFIIAVLNMDFNNGELLSLLKLVAICAAAVKLIPPFLQASQPDPKEEQDRGINLEKALKDPNAKKYLLTKEWYDETEEGIQNVMKIMQLVGGCTILFAFLQCFPLGVFTTIENFLQETWTYLLDNYSREFLYVWGSWTVFMVTYWVHGLAWAIVDFTRPASLLPFKNQIDYVLTWADFVKICKLVLFNCFIGLAAVWVQYKISGRTLDGVFDPKLPSYVDLMLMGTFGAFHTEVVFYYSHKWLHEYGWDYHKVHHEFKAPIALLSIYCHPVELILGNLSVILIPPFLINCHLLILWFFIFTTIMGSQIGHCGWHLPLGASTEIHDYHHSQGYDNLGAIGIFDDFYNTNNNWNKSWQKKIDKTYSHADYPVDKILVQQDIQYSWTKVEHSDSEWDKVEKE